MFTFLNFKSINEFFPKISNVCLAMNLTAEWKLSKSILYSLPPPYPQKNLKRKYFLFQEKK